MDTQRISRDDVVELLSASLGTIKAEHAVRSAATALQLGASFPLDQALVLLDRIAMEPGIVGITARFARTRAVLRWTP